MRTLQATTQFPSPTEQRLGGGGPAIGPKLGTSLTKSDIPLGRKNIERSRPNGEKGIGQTNMKNPQPIRGPKVRTGQFINSRF